jgi:hypothetical protein
LVVARAVCVLGPGVWETADGLGVLVACGRDCTTSQLKVLWVLRAVGPASPPVLNYSNIGARHLDVTWRVAPDLWDAYTTTGYWCVFAMQAWCVCLRVTVGAVEPTLRWLEVHVLTHPPTPSIACCNVCRIERRAAVSGPASYVDRPYNARCGNAADAVPCTACCVPHEQVFNSHTFPSMHHAPLPTLLSLLQRVGVG